MTVLFVYVVLVAICEVVVFFLGEAVDKMVPDGWNLIIAMAMFFGVIWAVWPVSVYITERFLVAAKPGRAHAAE